MLYSAGYLNQRQIVAEDGKEIKRANLCSLQSASPYFFSLKSVKWYYR